VIAGRDRRAAADEARVQGADVVVLDDGFQHRRLARTLDVVLLAVEDPFPGPVLPRGPYREPAGALARADIIVFTRRKATQAQARELEGRVRRLLSDVAPATASVHLAPGSLRTMTHTGMTDPVAVRDPLVVTAVARPHAVLEDARRRTGSGAELMAFEDHHEFSEAETRAIRSRAGERAILITEKDAVKLAPFAPFLGEVAVMTQELRWDWGEQAVLDRIMQAVTHAGSDP
jgi:tetraacyldisaccharide 4'-kinase